MRRPFVRAAVVVVCLAVLSAACTGEGGDRASSRQRRPPRTSTTTSSTSTTTTAPPPSTTTTTAPPAAVPLAGVPNARIVVSPLGVVLPVLRREANGFLVGTPCGNSTVVTSGTPVEAARVVLDAGHGGDEPGAVGPNGLTERALNLAVTGHTKAALERDGLSVVLTRPADYRITLESRAKVVTALRPDAFVSIHHNAEPDGPRPGPGTETYYQIASAPSKRLAGLIYEEVVKALSAYSVTWVADSDAGAKYRPSSSGGDYYGILRRTAGTPAVLAELAFVSNPPEAELLARADVQRAEGEAVARGIVRYLTTNDPGSGFTEPYPRSTPAGPGGGAQGCVDPPL